MNDEGFFDWFRTTMKNIVIQTPPKDKAVYLIIFNDGIVKIGISESPLKRIHTVSHQSGRIIKTAFVSKPTQFAREIEEDFKSYFVQARCNGEFFQITHEDAFQFLNDYEEIEWTQSVWEAVYPEYEL